MKKNAETGPEKAAKEIGASIFPEMFKREELKSIKTNVRKTQNVVGSGYGVALIHAFSKRGQASAIELLLRLGADVNAKDELGKTPLIHAVINRNYEVVQLLVGKGANLESTFGGNTALIEATAANDDAVVKLLLEHGAQIEAKNRDGHTALQFAAANSYVAIVQLLLSKGANVNTMDKNQTTPLMWAAIHNKLWMVELLLTAGAEVDAMDKDGETALVLHQNKQARYMIAMGFLKDLRDTPIARLLIAETKRRRLALRRTTTGL